MLGRLSPFSLASSFVSSSASFFLRLALSLRVVDNLTFSSTLRAMISSTPSSDRSLSAFSRK